MTFTRTLVAVFIAAIVLPVAPAVGDESPPVAEPTAAAPAAAEPAAVPPSNVFSAEQLDQIVAPIALYPDALLMQILMASTYPLEVIEAERWTKKNPDLKGDALDKALADKGWDPSVKSLTHFPTVLVRMSDNLDWTKDMGDAFLGQQKEVLDAIQRMRHKAYELGNLKSTPEQNVIVEPAAAKAEGQTVVVQQAPPQIIKIEPAQPQVVYVPTYSSTVVYGPPPPTVYYPAVYAYPPGYVATASLLSFGAGMAVGAALWGGCNWHSGDVNVNYNYNYTRNTNVGNINKPEHWRHDPQHRRGVNYRNDAVAKKYGQPGAADRAARDNARGYQRPGSAQTRPASTQAGTSGRAAGGAGAKRSGARPQASTGASQARGKAGTGPASASRRPGVSQQPRANQPASANRPAGTSRPSVPSRDTAFGSAGSGGTQRAASTRGAASRGVSGGSFARDRGSFGGGGRGGGGRRR
jgi:hypothetical protein